jgi:hypothetical protein
LNENYTLQQKRIPPEVQLEMVVDLGLLEDVDLPLNQLVAEN